MMRTKHLAAAVVATALMVGGAHAQTGTMSNSTGASTSSSASMHQEGEWRASKLPGVNVYNDNNDKVGSINDVILDKSGKIAAVIIGVGGFLGVGEHYVSVPFDQLKWSNEPVRTASSSSTSTGAAPPATNVDSSSRTAATDNSRMTTGAASSTSSNNEWYPDHAVMSGATKDKLKGMPEFKY
jgi:sporulation protein YlmC with PRC-barrel domain